MPYFTVYRFLPSGMQQSKCVEARDTAHATALQIADLYNDDGSWTDDPALPALTLAHGDCLDLLPTLADNSVNLILTSPPYDLARESIYGGVHPDRYVSWFMPRAAELQRVLDPRGSFVLVIKETIVEGEVHRYVNKLEDALRDQGWRLPNHEIWHKKNGIPITPT